MQALEFWVAHLIQDLLKSFSKLAAGLCRALMIRSTGEAGRSNEKERDMQKVSITHLKNIQNSQLK